MKKKTTQVGTAGINKNKKKQFTVSLKATNGNILMTAENFALKQSALKNIAAAGKLMASIMAGNTAVIDEQGHKWVMQKNGKFMNTTRFLRKKLKPALVALVKEINSNPLQKKKIKIFDKKQAKKK